jgi:hypothetical protein
MGHDGKSLSKMDMKQAAVADLKILSEYLAGKTGGKKRNIRQDGEFQCLCPTRQEF